MQFRGFISRIFLSSKKNKNNPKVQSYLESKLCVILGMPITQIEWYKEAFSLRNSGRKIRAKNYERLEFLGDSILGSIISCYLYEHYPRENEGFLTQMKSKIVNRKNLNKVGEDLQLTRLIINQNANALGENIHGNLLEALIGAIYLDKGYDMCKSIVLTKLLPPETIATLEHKIISYKGLLLEWSQKHKHILQYETQEEILPNSKINSFKAFVLIDGEKVANATDSSKKKAEEKAAQRAFYGLNKKIKINERTSNPSVR